jgi:hypothetical protein
MSSHLSSQECVSALDQALSSVRQAHLDGCATCQAQMSELRAVLEDAGEDLAVPEPSPLFWDHFPARVMAAVEAEATQSQPMSWWQSWTSVRTWLTASALVLTVVMGVALYLGRPVVPVTEDLTAETMADGDVTAGAMFDADEWAFVTSMMGSLERDEVREVLAPSRDAVDTAFEGLSNDERDRFMKLLKAELAEGLE